LADFGMDEDMREDLEDMKWHLLEDNRTFNVKVVGKKFVILSSKIL
jgi:hypothetical protein